MTPPRPSPNDDGVCLPTVTHGSLLSSVDTTVRSLGESVVRTAPALEAPLLAARSHYAQAYVRTRAIRNRVRFDAPVDPYELMYVDPARVVYRADSFPYPKFRYVGVLLGGNWDRLDRPFAATDVFRGFAAHFEDGVPWTETEFYDRVVDQIEDGHVKWECRSEAEFQERCADLDRLYATIRDEGYKSQRELAAGNGEEVIQKNRLSTADRFLEDEIALHVGRAGDLIFADGRNRMAIAKLLDLDEIPVRIVARHPRWQRLREAIASGHIKPEDVPGLDLPHPDVENIPR